MPDVWSLAFQKKVWWPADNISLERTTSTSSPNVLNIATRVTASVGIEKDTESTGLNGFG